MTRIRTVKPEFFRHEALQDLEIANPGKYPMMVFEALWGHCDSKGRFEWKPRMLKLDILPFLAFDMAETLSILDAGGMVRRYSVGGKEYGDISHSAAGYLGDFDNSKREDALKNATPKWLTKAHLQAIKAVYVLSKNMSESTGEDHHVDHIVPLCGKAVCGLHVPWNLRVITAKENMAKHARFSVNGDCDA